jgi:putrescine transport system permease protein
MAGGGARWFDRRGWRGLIIGVPYVWLVFFFLLPFVIVIAMSFAFRAALSPPFAFPAEWPHISWENYQRLASDSLYFRAFLTSLWNAALATLFCLLIGYPMALGITRVSRSWRSLLLMLVILPFWTSFLLRVYAWMGLLGNNSWFNKALTAAVNAVLPAESALKAIPMMNSNFAVVLVMVYSYLPFMILPLYANLEKHDLTLLEAAADLGARPFKAFLRITLPLSVPGIVAGCLLVFIPAVGEFVIPSLLGRADQLMIGRILSDEFFANRDWPVASAVAIVLLLALLLPIMVFQRYQRRELEAAKR